jgi:protein SCO1/2
MATDAASSLSQSRFRAWRNDTLVRRLVFAAAGLLLVIFPQGPASAQVTLPPEGSRVSFALTGTDGTEITEQSYRGKWLVVYFGYTFCPDICPTTLLEIAGALEALGPHAGAVQALFITIDPKRDTPSVLSAYVKSFDPRLVGLSGTPAQIAHAAKSFHVFYERQDTDNGSYSYDHSTFIYVVDPDGNFAKAITGEGGSKQIADALSALMNTGH